MRFLKKLNAALALALTLTLVAPVTTPVTPVAVAKAATVKINKTKKTLKVGQTYQLKITGTKKTVKWKSSKKKVATVSSKGKVKAKAVGKTNITATVGNKTYKCKITVKAAENKYVAKAPFEAKELKFGNYTAAMPKNWQMTETELNGIPVYVLTPEDVDLNVGTSNISITNTEYEASVQENFDMFAEYLSGTITKETFEALYGVGSVTDFSQETKEINLGKAVVTSYTITIQQNGQPFTFTQVIYDIFANGYTTEITITDNKAAVTPDVYEVGEYLANSLIYTK